MLSELSFIHANNLLHTDIKITNVMQFHGRYCFIDFGLCRFNACVPTTSLTGGERYTAPEVFQGMRTRASDIYALGCVLYYCITRRYLFDLDKKDPLEKKMHAAMYSSPDLSFSASKKVRYILSRMLEKDPMQRATIAEIEAIMRGDLAISRFAESGRDEPCPDETADIYRKLAEDRRRIVYAQYRYALLLEDGEKVAKNEAQAITWFKASAIAGYALAQHRLGFLYYRGRCGLKKDYGRALYWFGKAAEQRYHRAEYYLGRLHELGRGVAANKKKAAHFYRLAIANGDKAARKRLETLNHETTVR
jgi:TPR repeat protein